MLVVPDWVRPLRMASLGEVRWKITVHVADRRANYTAVARLHSVKDRADQLVGRGVETHVILDRVRSFDDLVVTIVHVLEAELACIDRPLDHIFDLPARVLRLQYERGIVNLGARIGESVEHGVRQKLKVAKAFLGGEELATVGARITGKFRKAGFHPVHAGLDHARRMGDTLGLAVDHANDLADFADRIADRSETGLSCAAALDARFGLRRDGSGLARQLADGRGDLARRGARVVR